MKKILLIGAINSGVCNASTLHFFSIAESFVKQDYEVEVIIPKPTIPIQFDTNPKISIYHKIKIRKFKLPNFIVGLLQTPWITFHIIRNKIPVVYLRYFNCASLLTFILRNCTKAKIITEHNGWLSDELNVIGFPLWVSSLAKKLQVLDAKLAHTTRVVTPKLGELFIKNGIPTKKIFCVGNGCNTKKIKPLERNTCLKELNLPLNKVYLGFIGTMHAWQGLDTAIKALKIIKQKNTEVAFIIAGTGPKLSSFKKLTDELGLSDDIFFLGQVQYSKISTVLGGFDIALAPFSNERNYRIGLSPLKIRDYAAAGLPVIASNIPGIKDYPTDTSWITSHPPGETEALANTVLELLSKKNVLKKMEISAREFAIKHFDWDEIGKKIANEIEKKFHP